MAKVHLAQGAKSRIWSRCEHPLYPNPICVWHVFCLRRRMVASTVRLAPIFYKRTTTSAKITDTQSITDAQTHTRTDAQKNKTMSSKPSAQTHRRTEKKSSKLSAQTHRRTENKFQQALRTDAQMHRKNNVQQALRTEAQTHIKKIQQALPTDAPIKNNVQQALRTHGKKNVQQALRTDAQKKIMSSKPAEQTDINK